MAKHIHIHLTSSAPSRTVDWKTNDFQPRITAKGRNYVSTGKLRNNGSECEYEELSPTGSRTGRFLWVAENGRAVGDEKVEDSEENDAYIKGHADAIAGKRQDSAFHPGGEKKPAVALKYVEGYKQGEKDRNDGGKK